MQAVVVTRSYGGREAERGLVVSLAVDFQALVVETRRLDDVVAVMDSRVAKANEVVSALLGEGWTGGASTAFSTAFQQWVDGASDCVLMLRELVSGLHASAEEFTATEHANVDTVQSLAEAVPSCGFAQMLGGS